jgi:hypothetical protein
VYCREHKCIETYVGKRRGNDFDLRPVLKWDGKGIEWEDVDLIQLAQGRD